MRNIQSDVHAIAAKVVPSHYKFNSKKTKGEITDLVTKLKDRNSYIYDNYTVIPVRFYVLYLSLH